MGTANPHFIFDPGVVTPRVTVDSKAMRRVFAMLQDSFAILLATAIVVALKARFPELIPGDGIQSRNFESAGAWQGIFEQKNICGSVLTLLLLPIFFVQTRSHYGQLVRWAYGTVLVLIIAMTRSTSAWLICASCILFIFAMRLIERLAGRTVIIAETALIGIALCAVYIAVEYSDSPMYLLGKDPTMTGRTVIWGVLASSIMKRPLVGYGYMAFWQGGMKGESANVALSMNWAGIGYSENGMIDLWLSLGAVAVLMFLLLFGRAIRDALYCFNRNATPGVMWYASILFFVAVSNIAAGQVLHPSSLGCILQIVAFVGLRQERRRLQAESCKDQTV